MLDVVVLLYASGEGAIVEFEVEAMSVLRAHGAEMLSAFRPRGAGKDEGAPDEVHVLRFPSRAAFDAYRDDPRLSALAALRQRVIARSELLVAERALSE